MVRVKVFPLIEPLRLKSKVYAEFSGPVVPLASALICVPETVPAKLNVTGLLSMFWLRLCGMVVGVMVKASCMLFPFCWTAQVTDAVIVPDTFDVPVGRVTANWLPLDVY